MTRPLLVIGNKNYSSWSLRPWLLLREFGVAFDELRLPLDTPHFHKEIVRWSPSRRVPVLCDGELRVHDSLAICEYINERWLDGAGWPQARDLRAAARSLASEMHAGYAAMRAQLPMNVRRVPGAVECDAEAMGDIARLEQAWGQALRRTGGPWLFGAFSIVDAFYAPVAWRFHGYALSSKDAEVEGYLQRLRALPSMQEWARAAQAETERIAADER